MGVSNLTDVLNGEDQSTIETIALGVAFSKEEINTSFKRSFVDLLEVSSWSFAGAVITLNVKVGHGLVATDTTWLNGLISTTNAPEGDYTVDSVTATTIVFTATLTPTGTPTVLNAIVYKTTYVDALAVGINPTAKIYHDGTIVGSTDNGNYEHKNGRYKMNGAGTSITTSTATGQIFKGVSASEITYPLIITALPNYLDVQATISSGEAIGGVPQTLTLTGFKARVYSSDNTSIVVPKYRAEGNL